MNTIYKYPIDRVHRQVLRLPHGAKILTIQPQIDKLFMWALVDTEASQDERTILMVGTGMLVLDSWIYVATVQDTGKDYFGYVWHFFEESAA